MKKKILITVLCVFVLLAGVLGYALYNANSLVAQFKPDIERAASDLMGSPVSLGGLNVAFFPGIKIEVDDFQLGIPTDGGARFKNLELDLSLLPLLRGKLEIISVSLNHPQIKIVKVRDQFEIAGLAKKKPAADGGRKEKAAAPPGKRPEDSSAQKLEIKLDQLKLIQAEILLDDTLSKQQFTLAKLDLEARVELLSGGVNVNDLRLSGDVLSTGKILASGKISKLGLKDADLSINGNISSVSNDDLSRLVKLFGPELPISTAGDLGAQFEVSGDPLAPAISASLDFTDSAYSKVGSFEKKAGDKLTLSLSTPRLKPKNFEASGTIEAINLSLLATGATISKTSLPYTLLVKDDLVNLELKQGKLNFPDSQIELGFSASKQVDQLEVKQALITGFAGTTSLNSKLNTNRQELTLNADATEIRVEQALSALLPKVGKVIEGTLDSLKLQLKGSLKEQLTNSLVGPISVQLSDGRIVGFNLAGDALKAVTSIPFISGSLFSKVPPEEMAKVTEDSTPIEKFSASFNAANGRLQTTDLKLVSSVFDLSAKGWIGFDASLDLNVDLIFNKAFSTALVSSARELKVLLNNEERLGLPLVIQGKAPKLAILPQLDGLLKAAAKAGVKEKLEGVLDKALKDKGLGGLLGF